MASTHHSPGGIGLWRIGVGVDVDIVGLMRCQFRCATAGAGRNSQDRLRIKLPKLRRFFSSMAATRGSSVV